MDYRFCYLYGSNSIFGYHGLWDQGKMGLWGRVLRNISYDNRMYIYHEKNKIGTTKVKRN